MRCVLRDIFCHTLQASTFNHSVKHTIIASITIFFLSIHLQAEEDTGKKEKSKDIKSTRVFVFPEFSKSNRMRGRFDRIVYNGDTTIIPKGAMLYLPEAHQQKINTSLKKSKALSWHDFYMKNKNFIHIVSLTKEQAFGTKTSPRYAIPYEKFEDLKKLGRIIVCTYKDSPIPVKILPKPEK